MRKRIKIASISSGLLAGIIVVCFLCAGFWLRIQGPEFIENRLADTLHSDVEIEKVRTNFFNSLTLHNVRIERPLKTTVSEVKVTFRPWNFLVPKKHRGVLLASVSGLDAVWDPSERGERKSSIFSWNPISATLDVSDSSLSVIKDGQRLEAKGLNGLLTSDSQGVLADLSGELEGVGPFTVSGKAHLRKGTWVVEAQLPRAQPKPVMDFFDPEKRLGSVGGEIHASFSANGDLASREIRDFKADLKASGLPWTFPGSPTVRVNLDLKATPSTIFVNALKVEDLLDVRGRIGDWRKTRVADFSIVASSAPISTLLQLMGKSQPASGTVSFDAQVMGPLQSPRIHANFQASPTVALIHVPDLSGQLTFEDDKLTVQGAVSGGQFSVSGAFPGKRLDRLNARIKGLDLEKLGWANDWKNVGGDLSGDLEFHPAGQNSSALVPFTVKGLRWGRMKSTDTVAGFFTWDQKRARISTSDNSLTAEVLFKADRVLLNAFDLNLSSQSNLSGHGEMVRPNGAVNLTIRGRNVPPDFWPPLVAHYPDITGRLDFDGRLKGTLSKMSADMGVVVHGLTFIESGSSWNGTAHMSLDEAEIVLEDIQVDGGYRGELRMSRRSKDWQIALRVDQASPNLILDVLRSTRALSGSLSGETLIQKEGTDFVGHSSITWSSGGLGAFSFEQLTASAELRQGRLHLDDVVLLKGASAIRGSATLVPGPSAWAYEVDLQAEQWGNAVRLDGEARVTGAVSVDGRKVTAEGTTPILLVNGYPLQGLSFTAKKDGDIFSLGVKGGPDLSLNVAANFRADSIRGQLTAAALNASDLAKTLAPAYFQLDAPDGHLKVKAGIEGALSSPQIHVVASLKDGLWRKEPLSSELVVDFSTSAFQVLTSKTVLGRGGVLFAQGQLNFGPEGVADFSGTGSDINLQSLMNLLRWPVRWEGKTNARFEFKGPPATQTAHFYLEGKHDGFGPFSKGGVLGGELQWQKGQWDLAGMTVQSGNGFVKLLPGSRIFIEKNGGGKMRVVSDIRNLQSGLLTFFGGAELSGSWAPRDGQSDARAAVELDVFARSLWINQFMLDGNVSRLSIKKGELGFSPIPGSGQQLAGTLEYKDFPTLTLRDLTFSENNEERFFMDGLIGREKWDFRMRARGMDAGVVRGLFDTTLPLSGPLDFDVTGLGSFAEPHISGRVEWKKGHFGPVPVDEASFHLDYDRGLLNIQDLVAQKRKGFQIRGRIKVDTRRDDDDEMIPIMDVSLERGDLALFEEIWPACHKARGSFQGRIKIDEVRGRRNVAGYLKVEDAQLRTSSYIPSLKNGQLHLRLDQNRLVIREGGGTLNEGEVKLTGYIDFADGYPSFYNVKLETLTKDGPSVRVPELAIPPGTILGRVSIIKKRLAGISRGDPIVNIQLTGSAQGPTLSGSIDLEDTVFTYPPQEKTGMARSQGVTARWLRDFRNKIIWDLNLKAGSRTRYENELVGAKIEGNLKIAGPTSDPAVNGKILSSQGSIVYSGNEFTLKEAVLEIVTPPAGLGENVQKKTYVYLKATAEKEVFYSDGVGGSFQDTIVMEVDRSLLGEIQPRFYSKSSPNMSSERALKLALGLELDQPLDSNSLVTEQTRAQREYDIDRALRIGLVQLLDSNLASPLARALARQTGLVDFIRVTYQQDDLAPGVDAPNRVEATQSNVTQNEFLKYMKGTKVRMGRELSSRLIADYSFKVDEFENQVDLRHEVELAYRVHRNLFVRATSELDSERTLGRPPDRRAVLENRWRFGLPRRRKLLAPDISAPPMDGSPVPPVNQP